MLRSIVSSIEFEKFRRNWSEKNSAQRFLWVGVQGVVALSLLFAPIFLRRTHVNLVKKHRIWSFVSSVSQNEFYFIIKISW
ncbi:hypothetical protein LEP1GSC170_4973 [Leptospira interrogans serovar Bataviae str. HAI135]|nr:hypothetical protein [Leptospira noguchii]EMO27413.1 hypothetical protein LEP1GSC170_4973 [Leptospira interrogans serovar Bataviae str. HAI135]UOG60866.1 hypothetical protein MAL07_01915 [Leptospira noguchii]